MQFSLKSLLKLTAVTAVVFAGFNVCVKTFPDSLIVVAVLSIPIAVIGLAMLIFAAFLAISMWVSPADDFHRAANRDHCIRMFIAGTLICLASTYFLAVFLIHASD